MRNFIRDWDRDMCLSGGLTFAPRNFKVTLLRIGRRKANSFFALSSAFSCIMSRDIVNIENNSEEQKDEFRTFTSIARWNLQHLRANPVGEISGSLGDLGTLLPILIALAQVGAIDLATTLVMTGLASIVAGSWFGYPLAVQPMKAIAGIVLARGMGLRENMAAGLATGGIVAVVSIVGIQLLLNIIPLPVVRGQFLCMAMY
jgi:Molybdate transporter of MFS superfamily